MITPVSPIVSAYLTHIAVPLGALMIIYPYRQRNSYIYSDKKRYYWMPGGLSMPLGLYSSMEAHPMAKSYRPHDGSGNLLQA